MKKIARNSARCKQCNTHLVSKHRHDFVACPCGNFVDGGTDYLRRGGNPDDLENTSVMFKLTAVPDVPKEVDDYN